LSADEITLQLPRERPFFGVAHLVVGGLAVRLDLSFEQLEDLQVALGELLEQHETEREITVSVRVEGDTIHALVGPFDESLEQELARDSGDAVGLRRVLETVVDGVEVKNRDGQPWVELTKAMKA
jgi:anti-sigma regulatory factor (Ser/Thr protein kinase)